MDRWELLLRCLRRSGKRVDRSYIMISKRKDTTTKKKHRRKLQRRRSHQKSN